MFPWMSSLPSVLESSRLGVKSWLWRIFSTTSSASTRVSSILFSWDSIESCFTGCLRGGYRKVKFLSVWQWMASTTNWRCYFFLILNLIISVCRQTMETKAVRGTFIFTSTDIRVLPFSHLTHEEREKKSKYPFKKLQVISW